MVRFRRSAENQGAVYPYDAAQGSQELATSSTNTPAIPEVGHYPDQLAPEARIDQLRRHLSARAEYLGSLRDTFRYEVLPDLMAVTEAVSGGDRQVEDGATLSIEDIARETTIWRDRIVEIAEHWDQSAAVSDKLYDRYLFASGRAEILLNQITDMTGRMAIARTQQHVTDNPAQLTRQGSDSVDMSEYAALLKEGVDPRTKLEAELTELYAEMRQIKNGLNQHMEYRAGLDQQTHDIWAHAMRLAAQEQQIVAYLMRLSDDIQTSARSFQTQVHAFATGTNSPVAAAIARGTHAGPLLERGL